jgi:glucose/arabinose dehydrogenase
VLAQSPLPAGFVQTQLADELDPTAMSIAPDGRIFICEKSGKIRIFSDGKLQTAPFVSIAVDNFNERGLSGMAFDPDFEINHHLYVYYTVPGNNRNRLSRFTANGNTAIPNSEKIIIEFEPMAGSIHNGGALAFDKDGKLYIAVGDGNNAGLAQNLNSMQGKILRINPDGTVPSDNPFTVPGNNNQKSPIWALGFRNPFTFALDPLSGKLFVNDVGNILWEEINEVTRGSNHGWPILEGPRRNEVPPSNYRDPLHAYSHQEGCAVVGGTFFNPPTTTFPEKYRGKYFFGEYCQAQIRMIDPVTGMLEETFLRGTQRPVSIQVGPDGNLYYLTRGTNRGGSVFDNTSATDGQLWKIEYRGDGRPFVSIQPKSTLVAVGEDALFTTGASGDPTLRYQWYKNDTPIPGANESTLLVSNVQLSETGAQYFCEIFNTKGRVKTRSATLSVTANNRPSIQFLAPLLDQRYTGGDTIYYRATATDREDGVIAPRELRWRIDFHHDDHVHPVLGEEQASLRNFFVVPRSGETAVTVYYRVYCTATDKQGLSRTEFVNILPRRSTFVVETEPKGIEVSIDGSFLAAPQQVNTVDGVLRVVTATRAVIKDDKIYRFKRWKELNVSDLIFSFWGGQVPKLTAEYEAQPLNIAKGRGLRALYFQGEANTLLNAQIFGAKPVLVRVDTTVNFNWTNGSPASAVPINNFAVRWLGDLEPLFTDNYTFHCFSDDGVRLWIDNQLVVDNWVYQAVAEATSKPMRLEVGKKYRVKMEFFEGGGEAEVRLWWSTPVLDKSPVPKSQLFPDPTPLDLLGSNTFACRFFPLPMQDKVNLFIRSSYTEVVTLRIVDVSGRLLQEQKLNVQVGTNLHEIDTSSLSPGVYFAQFLNGRNQYETIKLVKGK